MCICVCVYVYNYIYIYIYLCMYVYVYVYTHIFVYIYIYIYIYTYNISNIARHGARAGPEVSVLGDTQVLFMCLLLIGHMCYLCFFSSRFAIQQLYHMPDPRSACPPLGSGAGRRDGVPAELRKGGPLGVCIYIYIYIHIHIHTYVYMCIYVYTHVVIIIPM